MTVPLELASLGSTFDYQVSPLGDVTIGFYDSKQESLAKVKVIRPVGGAIQFTYWDKDGEYWFRTATSQNKEEVVVVINTSSGGEMKGVGKIDISKLPGKDAGKIRISSLSLSTETGFKEFTLDAKNATASKIAVQDAFAIEEGKLFSSLGMQKLRDIILNFGKLTTVTYNEWDKNLASVTLNVPSPSPNLIGNGDGGYELFGCYTGAVCTRIPSIFPVFYCYTGVAGACDGFYIVPDYVLYPSFTTTCGYLQNCV